MEENGRSNTKSGQDRRRPSRREAIAKLAACGLSAPMITQWLLSSGYAYAAPVTAYEPKKAGGAGTLRLLAWQAPTMLNPHFASGNKDREAPRLFYEPLASWDVDGNLVPQLAEAIPSLADGTVSPDAREVTWKLKKNVRWHDGKPFTADDVVFTAAYASDPESATSTIGSYLGIEVRKVDDHTVKVVFEEPAPFWADALVGVAGMILPKHVFEPFKGKASRDAPANAAPIGTGPYKFVEFRPGDILKAVRNEDYRVPNQPHFDAIEIKGGGDPTSAARAVLQTGDYHYALGLSVEDEVLKRMEKGGRGRVEFYPSGITSTIIINTTDPNIEINGERSHPDTKHPSFSNPEVRRAFSHLIDRDSIHKYLHGRRGDATICLINNPAKYKSKNLKYEFSIDKANEILDAAGYKRGPDGVRAKDGHRLSYIFQTSTSASNQKTQAIIKAACQKAGIEIEIKSVVASVYFSADLSNPDTLKKFYCDLEMHGTTAILPDPLHQLRQFTSWEIATKANKWQGRNLSRYRSEEADKLYRLAERETDPEKRFEQILRLSETLIEDNVYMPIIASHRCVAVSNDVVSVPSSFDVELWGIASWYRKA